MAFSFYESYAMGRSSSKDDGGGLIAFLVLIWFITDFLPDWLAKQFHNFYVWSEPFRTLFFQDFFYSTALYLLPIGIIYTAIHLIYGDELEMPVKTFLLTLAAGAIAGLCKIMFRISTGNWADFPEMIDNPFIGLLWLPVLLVFIVSYIALLLLATVTVIAAIYVWLSRLGNWVSDYIADKLKPEVVYIPPTPMSDYDKAVYNAAIHAFNDTFYPKPERRPFHNTLFIIVCVPIYTFFALWFLFCVGGCIYLLI
ncbi:MAG: hypothetical protein IJV35_01930 [Neisseriaceae bacterium]|nr:hypothetical protein [Neisseriaceae bacterium]